ncbi:MAG: HI0074 family nucleotidyltransferase substrate-binding subunit [Salinispira sp.]
MIRRFAVCMELAWKTMKDYMEHNGIIFAEVFPTSVIKEAGATKLIDNPELWLRALDDRNKMSHTYDFKKFERVIDNISNFYIEDCFGALYEKLSVTLLDMLV